MHVKTMEGLVGAKTNMNLMNVPMRVYKEARRKGDSETMERASECSDRAEEYKTEADEGMKKDAEEARKIAKEQREEAIQNRRDERDKREAKIEENRNDDTNTDTVKISEEGKVLLKDSTGLDNTVSAETKTDAVKEPVTYTKTGETVSAEQSTSISVSV